MFSILGIGMFWLLLLAMVAANPLTGAIVFALVVALLVLVVKWFGWLWGFGALTLVGLISGPALLLTPVIVVVMLMARWKGDANAGRTGSDANAGRIAGSETKNVLRPILLEPRDANRSR